MIMKENKLDTDLLISYSNSHYPPEFANAFWLNLRIEAARERIPIHGHFELTPRCNLDCKMCYVHLNKDQMMGCNELDIDSWKKIIDSAIKSGMIFVSLTGGECLTYKHFDELYLYLKSKGVFIFILTNGILLEEKLPLFLAHPPALIQVSVYGCDEETYESVTGKKAFGLVDRAIMLAHSHNLPLSIAVTASKLLPSVYNIVKKYYDHNIGVTVNKWLIPPYTQTERSIENLCLSPEEQVEIEREILRATNQENPLPYDGVVPSPPSFGTGKQNIGLSCAAGRSDFSINWKGEMCLCASLSTTTGHPLTDGFAHSWSASVNAADKFILPMECSVCDLCSVCNRCPAYHQAYAPQGHCNTTACQESILLVKHGLHRLDK